MLLPFQGAIMRMGFTQGVALGYGLLGFQPVSNQRHPAPPVSPRGIYGKFVYRPFPAQPTAIPPRRFCRADYKRAPIKTQGD